jgi:hypothetical protein
LRQMLLPENSMRSLTRPSRNIVPGRRARCEALHVTQPDAEKISVLDLTIMPSPVSFQR